MTPPHHLESRTHGERSALQHAEVLGVGRDGQPSPHRPRLVVSRSTCLPLSPSPHANSFIKGTAVINTHRSPDGWDQIPRWAGGWCLAHRRGSARTCSSRSTLSPTAWAARSRLQLALHAQRTAGLLHVARSAPGRDTLSGQWALARRHRRAAMGGLLKTTVMCEA